MLHDQHNTGLACPCGSGDSFNRCCESAIEGGQPAKTAEQLMRSRYSAFALGMSDYLIDTTHPDYRQGMTINELEQQHAETTWRRLTIVKTEAGREHDTLGRVAFIAEFSVDGKIAQLQEDSRFERIQGHWYYLDGEVQVKPA